MTSSSVYPGLPSATGGTPRLRHYYKPRGSSKSLFKNKSREVLLSGPAGTGKSRGCLEKIHAACLRKPHVRALIVRKTATSLTSTALVTYREQVALEAILVGDVEWYGGSAQEAAQYRYTNGSSITIGGMDKPSKIMSSEYDLIYVQEGIELTVDDWEALLSRLRNGKLSYHQLMADTNPAHPAHWLKLRSDAGDLEIMFSTHEENPRYFTEIEEADGSVRYEMTPEGAAYINGVLGSLTGVRKERFRYGRWVSAEGAIYGDVWDEGLCVINRTDEDGVPVIGKDWTRYWVVDFGVRHPFVMQCWAEDPEGRLYRYREIYMTGRMVEDHAKQMMREVTRVVPGKEKFLDKHPDGPVYDVDKGWRVWTEPRPALVICDHDAEGRMTLERYLGMSTVPARKEVLEGIERVAIRMRPGVDGTPGLYFLRDSTVELDTSLADRRMPTSTEAEIPGYVWKPDPTGQNRKEEPLKVMDDGCDCVRYLVAEIDLGPGSPNVRWVS
jgi:hypothetical protein